MTHADKSQMLAVFRLAMCGAMCDYSGECKKTACPAHKEKLTLETWGGRTIGELFGRKRRYLDDESTPEPYEGE